MAKIIIILYILLQFSETVSGGLRLVGDRTLQELDGIPVICKKPPGKSREHL
ncbi:hypothetical protein [Peptostreptococcus sp. MV1]|uniref:hypothetical protein n=1 Tax=Peptostreptococcus sp. MV1 TaxID=1219626 RepID=UPI001A9A6CF7|nr:hypothetical protein [Peptostreptococcus sp. MV1]